MTAISPAQQSRKFRFPVPWVVMFGYLAFMLVLPAVALFAKAFTLPPQQIWEIATSDLAIATYIFNFSTAFYAALLNGVLGTLLAWVLVRYSFPGKKLIDAAVDLPFALPTAVAGIVLTTVYSDNGWIGSLFAANGALGFLFPPEGLRLAFSKTGVFIAMVFIGMPFAVRTLQPVLEDMEKEVEEAAWCLGASQALTFWKVILPPLMPAILTGLTLSFSRAVGEFGSIVIISANIPFDDLIAPVLIFERLEQYDYAGATVIGMVLMLLSLVLILIINLLQRWGRRYDA